MRKLYTLIACVSCICSIYAQQGDYLLTQHFPRHSNLDNSNFEIINDGKGRICVANRSGVLKYDGESWDFYATPSAALSLAVDTMDAVYVGCIGTVGVINFQNRKIQYQPLVDTINDLFLETHRQGDRVFFLGNKYLISYSISTEEIKKYEGNFLNMYSLDGALFVNSSDGTTYQLLDSLTEVNSSQDIAFISSSNERPDLIINFQGELYSYQDLSYDKLPQNKLIQEGGYEIQEAHWINDTLFVCSTFESGLLFFNTNQPEKIDITDYHSGLPDNEIFTIHCINEDVWAAHEFGITQISPLFPAYSYTHFQGLEGNLTSISLMNDKLWVTTSLGLYHFAQDTIYENKVYYEVIKKSRQRPTQKKQKPEATAQKVTTQKKEKKTNEGKPVLKRLFGKKKRATTNLVAKESQEEEIKPKKKSKGLLKKLSTILDKDKNKVEKVKGKLAEDTEYRRRIQKIPVDVEYSFDKIEGTNGKFLAVLPYRDKLLAVSTSGIYEIKEDEAEVIIEENIETFTVNHLDQLIISTSDLSLKFYKLIDEVWIELMSEPTDDIIVALKEDSKDRLWLAGSNTVYKTASTDTSFQLVDSYQLDNAYLDRVTLFEFNEKTYFINSNGYFFYDEESNTIEEDKKLKESIGSPIHHLFDDSRDAVWVYTGKIWHCLSADGSSEPFEYMGLFPDLR